MNIFEYREKYNIWLFNNDTIGLYHYAGNPAEMVLKTIQISEIRFKFIIKNNRFIWKTDR